MGYQLRRNAGIIDGRGGTPVGTEGKKFVDHCPGGCVLFIPQSFSRSFLFSLPLSLLPSLER